MKNLIKKLAPYLVAFALISLPVLALAQGGVSGGLTQSGLGSAFGGNTGVLGGARSAKDLIIGIIKIMLFFAGLIAVLFVIIGGYWYITSAGNEEQAEKGKSTLVNAIIGIVLIVLSYVIITVVTDLVSRSSGVL